MPRRRIRQGAPNTCQNTFHILEHLVVPKPQHPIARDANHPVTAVIRRARTPVLPAIQLDHQFGRVTGKIDDIPGYRHLAAKAKPGKLAAAQLRPETLFRQGLVRSQSARKTVRHRPSRTSVQQWFRDR